LAANRPPKPEPMITTRCRCAVWVMSVLFPLGGAPAPAPSILNPARVPARPPAPARLTTP
jgi:hypothetical protein